VAYVDESGFASDMPRTHGYSEVGKRCFGSHDWNAKGRENVLGALINGSLIGCGIVQGNVDSDVFNTWLEKILIPELPQNSVVIMDNAAFHKSSATKAILDNYGHTLEFLPPYSPDFNLIEQKWSQAKSIRRKYNCSTFELFQKYLL
jgi:transposase